MAAASESPYRTARRAFIAACEAAHVDPIARLHPAKDKDGKPLFMDSTALGPRHATRAVLVIAVDAVGSAIMVDMLQDPPSLPDETRLVLIHALDPAALAGVRTDPDWPAAMLTAVATEDLSRTGALAVLPLVTDQGNLTPPLAAALPKAAIQILSPAAGPAEAKDAIARFFRD
jgi:hypothetical protein